MGGREERIQESLAQGSGWGDIGRLCSAAQACVLRRTGARGVGRGWLQVGATVRVGLTEWEGWGFRFTWVFVEGDH